MPVRGAHQRKPNFSPAETEMAISLILGQQSTLFGSNTASEKQRAWQAIVRHVNAVYQNNREVEDLKKKWRVLRKEAKRKQASNLQLPASQMLALNTLELRVLQSLDEVTVTGVLGLDSARSATHERDDVQEEEEQAGPSWQQQQMLEQVQELTVPKKKEETDEPLLARVKSPLADDDPFLDEALVPPLSPSVPVLEPEKTPGEEASQRVYHQLLACTGQLVEEVRGLRAVQELQAQHQASMAASLQLLTKQLAPIAAAAYMQSCRTLLPAPLPSRTDAGSVPHPLFGLSVNSQEVDEPFEGSTASEYTPLRRSARVGKRGYFEGGDESGGKKNC
ncbi:uncharacterized protein LOC115463765 [Microcaecilia unicolor]|uniref:Uncharacterized protein LOC115463765 n=1 Tax=Microcaecilia unicolor TaxID=1415580 RepID=A0A6P7XJC1_9AMPH|nr:uncharacterized protein LOC115463765 [Microcaecilia unicolor]